MADFEQLLKKQNRTLLLVTVNSSELIGLNPRL